MPSSSADRPSDPADHDDDAAGAGSPAGRASDRSDHGGAPADGSVPDGRSADPDRRAPAADGSVPDGRSADPNRPAPAAGPATPAGTTLPGDVAGAPDVAGGRRQLSPRAIPYWRVDLALTVVPVAAVLTAIAVFVDVPSVLRVGVPALAWLGGLAAVAVVPPLRRRIWWYAIGEEEIDLREGLFVITRTVVPMVRVQHVDLHRGPISTRLGLAEIELHTAAGSVKIPALDRDEAERIRRQVSVLARVPDDL